MNQEHLDKIGRLADSCDSVACASRLPLPPQMHIEEMSKKLQEVAKELKEIYVKESGQNPWENHPD